jgi:hypothetical protein
MTNRTWRERFEAVRDFLVFWGPLADETRAGEAKARWVGNLRRELGTRNNATLDAFAARWQDRYDDIEVTRGTITTRANSLLLFVGVLTTGAGLIAQTFVGARGALVALLVLVGVPLLYSGVAAAVLAVRAQMVTHWDAPRIDFADATDERSARLTYAVEIFVAAEQNRMRLRRPVGFLRDGQYYAVGAIALVAMLVALSVTATLLKPPPVVNSPAVSSAPAVPSVTPRPLVTATPMAESPPITVPPSAPVSSSARPIVPHPSP